MTKIDSLELLRHLVRHVPAGTVTTYGELSTWAFGNAGASQAIVAMLNAAVRVRQSHAEYTNRVVRKDGGVVDVNGQLDQLLREGIRISNGKVDMKRTTVVRFAAARI